MSVVKATVGSNPTSSAIVFIIYFIMENLMTCKTKEESKELNRPPKFAIGHNVNLECRLSLDMTVISFEEDGGGYSYTCYWFDTYSHIQS